MITRITFYMAENSKMYISQGLRMCVYFLFFLRTTKKRKKFYHFPIRFIFDFSITLGDVGRYFSTTIYKMNPQQVPVISSNKTIYYNNMLFSAVSRIENQIKSKTFVILKNIYYNNNIERKMIFFKHE